MALKEQDGEQQYAVICANDGSVERERERDATTVVYTAMVLISINGGSVNKCSIELWTFLLVSHLRLSQPRDDTDF